MKIKLYFFMFISAFTCYMFYIYKMQVRMIVNSISYHETFGGLKSSDMENKTKPFAKDGLITGMPKINELNEIVKEIKENQSDSNRIILDLDEILKSSSDVVWPVVVMGTLGRTGNCMNTYAVSLALKKEFGTNATIAVTRRVFDLVATAMDPQGLTLHVAEKTFTDIAREKKMTVWPPVIFKNKKNLVAHIKPSIINEITNFQKTQQKKILILEGYPNRMYMIADHKDDIRRSFQLKSNLLKKAQEFLCKVSEGRESGLVFVGFHIRRTEYVRHSQIYNGVNVPGPQYYEDALEHYRHLFDNVIFVVASDDLSHAKLHLKHHQDIVFSEMKTHVEDMALLASCNHSIMTVGSFGWWSSFLAGGDVVYALLFNFTIPPFAHPEMLGPHGFENFHGIPFYESQ